MIPPAIAHFVLLLIVAISIRSDPDEMLVAEPQAEESLMNANAGWIIPFIRRSAKMTPLWLASIKRV
jgi:hypothetical protein